ncbi:18564_t:CDS:2 [Acaulospora morrowiae]|uniref:18564_t:CDS:1 n=1 Tax=Acaulospora morrowiae TaxID=94023 RepID=A0A9N9F5P0_9GLOM|nr:18564_t:CDS:2 [Acaulospora morrowiae]
MLIKSHDPIAVKQELEEEKSSETRSSLDEELEEIKEFHFHVYFFQDNQKNRESALALREKIVELTKKGFFHPVPFHNINFSPVGPHSIGSYEVWCPKEYFSRTYSWFLLNRGVHSVLVHPLTKEQLIDHTDRAAWMGQSVPLDLKKLPPVLKEVPKQYPELGLGYSAPEEKKPRN